MIAFVTTTNEPTTDLCVWALKRNGFEVHTVSGEDSLASKLKRIYEEASNIDTDFLRVDADIIVNRNMTPDFLESLIDFDLGIWWWQFTTFDWYKQDIAHCMSFVRREAVPALNKNIDRFMDESRPETECSRIKEFYSPRRFETYDTRLMGIHGYGIKNMKPVIKLKASRGQSANYDFDLAMRLYEL